ncbi:hypothetical protein [Pelagicoccus sp. SDUM812002]|uniref:hypothetical protein n=1 Tax=Pelagicoccus sp. SDUM812002 TaxID=3041266 RepID=UPI00280CF2C8|nr:hypothetical protein [Pelagicoccus sp. SDUM812002]MDQ8185405.1 hypothetical protein [Pelagicoccus sp. SDUM812002]
MPRIRSLNRTQIAVVLGQVLSFLLIITFIFANQRYDFLASIGAENTSISLKSAYVSACLVGLVGAFSVWITLHYLSKSNAMRDMVVVCAWTHQVKVDGRWVSFREFLSKQLGYAVSHGMCDAKLHELRSEVEKDWRGKEQPFVDSSEPKPLGMKPVDNNRPTVRKPRLSKT